MKVMWTLLLLLHIAQADSRDVDFCDARVNNTQCYGALGGTIKIQLVDSSSTTHRCIWKKNSQNIFEWKNSMTKRNKFQTRSDVNAFNQTGIIQILNLTKSDTDSYSLEIFYENGTLIKKSYHELIIEAPVSSVLLQLECLYEGEVRASCVSQGGDSPVYSWTLNGQNLTDSELLSKNQENNITLRQNTKGQLNCSVQNHISQKFKEIHINSCEQTTASSITSVGQTPNTNHSVPASYPSPPSSSWYTHITEHWPIILVSLLAAIIAGVAIICGLKKCKKRRDKEPEQELTYANVRILKQQETRRPRRSEAEVVYGQVKFSHQSPHTTAEDSIYSKVRG